MTGTVLWSSSAGWAVTGFTDLPGFMTIPPLISPSGGPLTIIAEVVYDTLGVFPGPGGFTYDTGWAVWQGNRLNQVGGGSSGIISCQPGIINPFPMFIEGWYTDAGVASGGPLDLHIDPAAARPAAGLLVVFVVDFAFGYGWTPTATVAGGFLTNSQTPTTTLDGNVAYAQAPLITWCFLRLVDGTSPSFVIHDPSVVVQGSGVFSANGATLAYVYFVGPYANPAGLYGQPPFPFGPGIVITWTWSGATVHVEIENVAWYPLGVPIVQSVHHGRAYGQLVG